MKTREVHFCASHTRIIHIPHATHTRTQLFQLSERPLRDGNVDSIMTFKKIVTLHFSRKLNKLTKSTIKPIFYYIRSRCGGVHAYICVCFGSKHKCIHCNVHRKQREKFLSTLYGNRLPLLVVFFICFVRFVSFTHSI